MGSLEEKAALNIPTIDFLTWTAPDFSKEERLATARELVEACHDVGFVYLKNHGISPQLLEEIFAMSKKFHDLPMEKKMLAANAGNNRFRGYSWPGLESSSAISEEKVVDFTVSVSNPKKMSSCPYKEQESYASGSDENEEPNVWPPADSLPGFRELNTKFYWECWRTSELFLKALAIGLGLPDEDFLLRFHTGHENELSIRHYPLVPAKKLEDNEMRRLCSHTDFDSFTLLFQDDCGGLEVEKKGCPGVFVPVDPIEGAAVVNIGDALMRWSNDYLTSTKHRVHLPPLQDRYTSNNRMTRRRYSIPYFVSPKFEAVMECLPGCFTEDNPPKYEPMTYQKWFDHQVALVFNS